MMQMETPHWLTKEFIQDALQSNKEVSNGYPITVEHIHVEKATAKGDNYACEILRVKADYIISDRKEELLGISLILKVPITSDLCEMIMDLGITEKEVSMYNDYLPKVNELIGENDKLTANSFLSTHKRVVILEDLKCSGFVLADRHQLLDYEHCVVALKRLAKFHAASVKLHNSDPELLERVGKEIFFTEEAEIINQVYVKTNFQLLAKECKATPELSCYSEKLIQFSENSWDVLIDLMKPKEKRFNVSNHGDFWVNNILFKYAGNEPTETKFIDLQLSRYTTPAADLIYFFYGSVQENVRTDQYDDLLLIYLTELNFYLEEFGLSERLSEAELRELLNETEFFAILVTCTMLFMIIGKSEDTYDAKEVSTEDFKNVETNPMVRLYKNDRFKEILKKRLREFEEKGWF